ncbi:hypothetical protein D9619_012806 [Psilocybe cf. subviscida]|uniref:Peptidase metallopeptidase domain-containing protein n=1 Tax=Psilocybe cf. subviscida TaxID=2480587 RepID=A0A8H5ER09_9AGAR|nr:hypothetical protein D9619_012806 [Psilocybe cf. subviscida]
MALRLTPGLLPTANASRSLTNAEGGEPACSLEDFSKGQSCVTRDDVRANPKITPPSASPDRMADDIAQKMADDIAQKMADNIAQKMADDIAQKMADNIAQKMADDIAQKMADNIAQKMADNIAQKIADNIAQKMADNIAQKMADDIAQKMADDIAQKMADDIAQKMADDIAQKMADEMADEMAQEIADEIAQDMVDEMAQEMEDAVSDEDHYEDDSEPEAESRRTCLAIPYVPSEHDGVNIPDGAGGAVLVQEDYLWDNGATITYAFMPQASKRHEWGEDKVHNIVKEWSLYANITFEHVQDAEDALVRITFDRSDGSWSLTGRKLIKERPRYQPTMNLGGVERINKVQESDVGTILHEFGHVLGLKHEHQSPLRNDVFRMNRQYAFKKPRGLSAEFGEEQILRPYNSNEEDNYTDLNLTSIMMYFMPAAQNDKGIKIKPNNKLSDYDKAFMLIHYPYFGFEPQVDEWDFVKALDVFGIYGQSRDEMMELYGAGNVRDLRRHFADVYESIRDQQNVALA